MSTGHTFLAVYLGSMSGEKMKAWHARPEAERKAMEREGMAAWHRWVEKHKDVIVEMGGPLGKTRRIDANGITEVSNALTGFTVVRAASQEEAARLFENHPHFAIFPGEAIEIMPVLPVPQM
ncbi:MAG: YciI family protein [Bradyrhizobium sp.]|jgi:hypothetical protein|uniref:YciI family protein n=1 Tax=unclassified Bradyrhizobium TaxID=2631580 RepID=UPI00070E1BA4|nr:MULTISPECIES: YciI family protein [unclassified Bradyrhizobium]KQT24964.1 hypothetical protein ASG57_23345 [Bradyrhizobium sp. Leaf396]